MGNRSQYNLEGFTVWEIDHNIFGGFTTACEIGHNIFERFYCMGNGPQYIWRVVEGYSMTLLCEVQGLVV